MRSPLLPATARTITASSARERTKETSDWSGPRRLRVPAVGSYRRKKLSITATNTAHSAIRTRKRLKAVSSSPSEGRREPPPVPVGTDPVDATATTATRSTTAAAIASVRAVDPPRRGALPSMPDETSG